MAGLPWFKLAGDFFAHPKTLELQAELGDPSADVYVVRMWAYVSRVAATGRITGRNVATVLERAVGWHGEPGRLVAALLRVGFLEQEPDALVVHDWATEQGAHVAKVEKDRKRPRADRRVSHISTVPARDLGGVLSGSREGPEVEIEREMENKNSPSERAASPTAAAAASPTVDDIPDATDDAQPVEERPALVLVTQKAAKPARKQSKAEALFARLEARREEMCREHGLDFVPTRSNWPAARINRDLGPIAREEESDGPAWQRFRAAWWEFLSDPNAREADVPFSLDWFWKARDRYYGRSLKAAGVAQ